MDICRYWIGFVFVDITETILKTSRNLNNERFSKRKKTTNTEDEEKRYRSTFDKSQISVMERAFLQNHYPDVAGRSDLSQRTGLSEQQVQVISTLNSSALLIGETNKLN